MRSSRPNLRLPKTTSNGETASGSLLMQETGILVILVSLALFAGVFAGGPAEAGSPKVAAQPNIRAQANTPFDDPNLAAVAALEQNYFKRTFEADSLNKRLKRLELFLTGESNVGSNPERLAQLKQLIKSSQKPPTSKYDARQSVSSLEQLILKKATPQLDLNTRLSKLEKKVFAASFPNLPVAQRIARLKKTLGVEDENVADLPSPQYRKYRNLPQFTNPDGTFSSPFPSPFGSPNDFTNMDPETNRQMAKMFDQLNRQLRELQKLPPGIYGPPSGPDSRRSPDDGYEIIPDFPHLTPDRRENRPVPKIPPYMDQNSI